MSKSDKLLLAVVASYMIMFLVCFGPATVDTEKAIAEHKAECAKSPQTPCPLGPSMSDGAFKAMFWPLWLSYKVAKWATKSN